MKRGQNLIGIKYCGGCRAGYDRKAALQSIRGKCAGQIYKIAEPGTEYDYLLVLCNCSARCADCGQYKVRKGIMVIDHALSEEELDEVSRMMSG